MSNALAVSICGKAYELPSSDSRPIPVAVPAHKLFGGLGEGLRNGLDSKQNHRSIGQPSLVRLLHGDAVAELGTCPRVQRSVKGSFPPVSGVCDHLRRKLLGSAVQAGCRERKGNAKGTVFFRGELLELLNICSSSQRDSPWDSKEQ